MSLVLAVLLSATVAGLIARARNRRRSAMAAPGASPRAGAQPSGLRALLVVLALVVLGEAAIVRSRDPPAPADPLERAHRLRDAGLREHAEAEMAGWVATHLDSVAAHYRFIHFALEERRARERRQRGRELIDFYQRMSAATQEPRRDVARFALGLCWSMIGDYPAAIARFDSVSNRELPYLNNSEGYSRMQLGMTARAESLFWKEIRLGYNVRGAVFNLAHLALGRHDWPALANLLADRRTAGDVPDAARRALQLHQGRLLEYLLSFLATYRIRLTWAYILVALYGSLVWFLLIRWWDLFEKEPLGLCFLTVIGGAVAAHGVYAFHDVLSLVARVTLAGRAAHDYLYFFAIVGLVEETVKLLPLALVLRLTRHINEPVDWLVYACLSALGFSVSENYEYLSRYGLHVGLARVFFTTPLHLSLSGMLAMSIPAARRFGRNPLPSLFAALLVVAAAHGTFDFLIYWNNGEFGILSFCLAALSGAAFINGVGRFGTLSPFRDRLGPYHLTVWPWFLAAFVTLCFITFAINAAHLPHAAAERVFVTDLTQNLGLLVPIWIYARVRIGAARDAVPARPAEAEPTAQPDEP